MIPRGLHALLDAASAAGLVSVPALMGWRGELRWGMAAAGAGVAAYSLLTRYDEDGQAPLSMREHLALDGLQGVAFCLAGARERDATARRALLAYGAFSIAAAALTDPGPGRVPVPRQVPLSRDSILRSARGGRTEEIAQDVAWRRLGIVNVVFLGPPGAGDRGWVLVDAGLNGTARMIEAAAAERFGHGARPRAIVLTHGHFDHVGALQQLARRWDAPIYAHTLEHPFLTGQAAYPLGDPTLTGAMAALCGFYPTAPVDVSPRLQALPEDGSLPGLPGWRWIHTPGHAPGHVSLWRERDRTLVAGDAVVTTRQESALAVLRQAPEMHGPPAYFTPDWTAARHSVRRLADLAPEVIVAGHGPPMGGARMRMALHDLARHFDDLAVPHGGRYAPQRGSGLVVTHDDRR
ncbi:MBL fold metallo-hydrolase [Citreimonas sp.]|uniref:MBL fold metallo-hydrolase n=1 Tax=Citreimonas sp. TaxID=3036715 RepID=UPI0035C7B3EB